MKLPHLPFFDSCRCNTTADATTIPLAAGQKPVPTDGPTYLWSKTDRWHSVSPDAPRRRRKIDIDGELTAAGSRSMSEEAMRRLAVEKKSVDPRADFRRSMAEMVVEKRIYGPDELERLLDCFLSLNSKQHHVCIVAAFVDIWEALFPAAAGGDNLPANYK